MEQFYDKHYIRVDASNRITSGFSDAFEQPEETDICINQEGGRHFELLGQINPPLVDMQGCHLYKYEGGVVQGTTADEKKAELEVLPKQPESLEEKVNNLTIALSNMIGA
jgi:hypothetical protein